MVTSPSAVVLPCARVKALLEAGADPDATGVERPLQIAIAATRTAGLEPMRLLLDAGADPNARSEFGDPVHFIAGGAGIDVEVARMLTAHGADWTVTDANGRGAVVLPATTRKLYFQTWPG